MGNNVTNKEKNLSFLNNLNNCDINYLKNNFKNYFNECKLNKKDFINPIDFKNSLEKIIDSYYELNQFLNNFKTTDVEKEKYLKKIIKKTSLLINKNLNDLNENRYPDKKVVLDTNANVILKVSNVNKYYYNKKMAIKILNNINFEVYEGDFVVILGPSGSGKTTLMNLISGMDKPSFGKVWVNGYHLEEMTERDLTLFRKNVIGYVFQRYGLLPNLTIYENVLMGNYLGKEDSAIFSAGLYKKTSYTKQEMKDIKKKKKEEYQKNSKDTEKEIYEILNLLELRNFAEKYPYQLSGGQKQRTSIARTIAKKPKIIFGDEPTGAVDSQMSKTIVEAFDKINKELKTTVIIITHDESIATYANKVIYLLDGYIDKIINKEKGQQVNHEIKKN